MALGAFDVGVKVAAVRGVPEAVVDNVGVLLGHALLHAGLVFAEGHALQGLVGGEEGHSGGGLVDLPGLDTHQPIFDVVDAADAMSTRQLVEVLHQVHGAHLLAVEGHGGAFLERDL